MNSLWTVALSVLAILFTGDLHAKRIGRNVIQSNPNRARLARQVTLHPALELAIRPHSAHALRKKQIPGNSPTEVLQWLIMIN